MARDSWRDEVARLLERSATCLRANNDRQALIAFGTTIGYLFKLRSEGERAAEQMLAQFNEAVGDGSTQRFSFMPGELEELAGRTPQK